MENESNEYICPQCGKKFLLSGIQYKRRKYRELYTKMDDPFCSKECVINYYTSFKLSALDLYNKYLDQMYNDEKYNIDIQYIKDKIEKDNSIKCIYTLSQK